MCLLYMSTVYVYCICVTQIKWVYAAGKFVINFTTSK